jgi:hypothetical protein
MTRSIVPILILFSSVGFAGTRPEHRFALPMLNLRATRLCAVAYIDTLFFEDICAQSLPTGCRHGSRDRFVEREQTIRDRGEAIQEIHNWKWAPIATSISEMEQTAAALLAPYKGILATEENINTIGKRFKTLGVASS